MLKRVLYPPMKTTSSRVQSPYTSPSVSMVCMLGLSLLACEAEIIYKTTKLNADLNVCLNTLQLTENDGCGQFIGSSDHGCFILSDQSGSEHKVSVRFSETGLEPLDGAESLFGPLSFEEGGGFFSLYMFDEVASEDASARCQSLRVDSACSEGCALALINQPLTLVQDDGELRIDSPACEWSVQSGRSLAEIECDGIDNDCDLTVDETTAINMNNEVIRVIPNITSCAAADASCESIYRCADGEGRAPTCLIVERDVSEECDQLDNDCDGMVDEDFAIEEECEAFYGICKTPGVTRCANQESIDQHFAIALGELYCHPDDPSALELSQDSEVNGQCNGLDDDCDSFIDEHFISQLEDCGEGSCAANALNACVNGITESRCREGEIIGPDTNCDQVDDDCDGRTDENFINRQISCGLGVCTNIGTVICTAGGELVLCEVTDDALRPDTSCDGIDNDCDGDEDEAYTPVARTCGVGACTNSGFLVCSQGIPVDRCVPGNPQTSDANCDGVDDDCDGRVDEDYLSLPTSCGIGLCSSTGIKICQGGDELDTCQPGTPQLGPDLCDSYDSDCDDLTDEDHQEIDTECGEGVCKRQGSILCNQQGQTYNSCTFTGPLAGENDASCNNTDEDCDGRMDEGFIRANILCDGVGSCASTGTTICREGGILGTTCVIGEPAANDVTCDNRDDDCDGQIDEDYTNDEVTTCGLGICSQQGDKVCIEGLITDTCEEGLAQPTDTVCDGIDSDCDGRTDEGYVITAISCGFGVCNRAGTKICENGRIVENCQPNPPQANDDTSCDNRDNDCDGKIDENFVVNDTSCGEGLCEREGQLICSTGQVVNTCRIVTPAVGETDSLCDGIDADCDGQIDEGYQVRAITCGIGFCRRNGQTQCVMGSVIENCTPGLPAMNDATCDQVDNNCNGETDEGYVPVSVLCAEGACTAMGQELCTSNGIVNTCVVHVGADTTCNGVDEDCDGVFDEGYIPPTSSETLITCGVGACFNSQGSLACIEGNVEPSCEPLASPGPDNVCNGIDDDCDGSVDEHYQTPTTCGLGVCQRTGFLVCIGSMTATTCVEGTSTSSYDRCVPPPQQVLDENCDGVVTEYPNLGNSCTKEAPAGVDACPTTGILVCNGDQSAVICNAPEPQPVAELCDEIDNDCDGITDEFAVFDPPSCIDPSANGQCQNGLFECQTGSPVCVPSDPIDEIYCNGLNDDCDGRIDEEYHNGNRRSLNSNCGGGCKWLCGPGDTQLTCRNPTTLVPCN